MILGEPRGLIETKMTDQWLLSVTARRLFGLISALQGGVLAVLLLLGYSELYPEKWNIFDHSGIQVVCGLIGGLAALGAILLIKGMKAYWTRLDDSPKASKRFWHWVLALGVNFGAALYCIFVYQHKRLRTHEP